MTRRPFGGRLPDPRERIKGQATASKQTTTAAYVIRSSGRAGGHAIGGQVISRYRATEAGCCGCCGCFVNVGHFLYEVLTAADVLAVCGVCAGETW